MPTPVNSDIIGVHEKLLLYGLGGSGKTFTAGTMPGKVYFIVFGGPNEVKTLMSQDFRKKHPEKTDQVWFDYAVEEIGARGHFKSATAYDMACDLLDDALEQERKGDFEFDSVVIDSATGLRRFGMNKAIEINFHRATGQSKTALKRLRDENIIIPGDNDWMSEMSLTTQFMDWVFRLPKHVCVCTHEWQVKQRDRGTGDSTVTSRLPLFTGKNREEVPAMFDNVWHIRPRNTGRGIVAEAVTVADEFTFAKTRMGGILAPIERDPDLTKLIEKMRKGAVG